MGQVCGVGGIKLNFKYMIALWFFIIIFVLLISWGWVSKIDDMTKNHPDYKGEDFLNWDKMEKYENDLYGRKKEKK